MKQQNSVKKSFLTFSQSDGISRHEICLRFDCMAKQTTSGLHIIMQSAATPEKKRNLSSSSSVFFFIFNPFVRESCNGLHSCYGVTETYVRGSGGVVKRVLGSVIVNYPYSL